MKNNSELKMIYISYEDLGETYSGSVVRPRKMFDAFSNLGVQITSLTGNQFAKERIRNVRSLKKKLQEEKFDFCYIESPTYPIMRHIDRALIKEIVQKGIPIGYFYRDMYRKFPDQFPRRTDFMGKLKDSGLDCLQYFTDRTLHKCDVIYYPSKECFEFSDFSCVEVLPPAGENFLEDEVKEFNYTGIYVGGIIGHYNGELIVNTFNALHKRDDRYKLILVCRKNEWDSFTSPFKNAPWLEVHHTSGEGLIPLYRRASFAISAGKKDFNYNNLAISVKIFEYLSYGLPQVAVNCTAIDRMFKDEKIGISVNDNANDFSDAIELLANNKEVYEYYINIIRDSLLTRNMWTNRAKKVISDLLD